jgi:hypothetical protein
MLETVIPEAEPLNMDPDEGIRGADWYQSSADVIPAGFKPESRLLLSGNLDPR